MLSIIILRLKTYSPRYFIVLVVVLLCANLNGQSLENKLNFQSIKKEISQTSISAIYEDSYGFLWLGTPQGLKKYDGSNFEDFEKTTDGKTGLSNSFVTCLFESDDKTLFIASYKGLSIYDRTTNKVKPYQFIGQGKILRTKDIITIEAIDQHLIFGTANSGVYKYNRVSGETKHLNFQQKAKSRINYHLVLKTSSLNQNTNLVITQAGIYIIDDNLKIIKKLYEKQHFRSVVKIDENNFAIGSQYGDLFLLEIDKNLSIKVNKKNISKGNALLAIEKDDNDNIWIGSENDGLFVYSKSEDKLTNHTPSYNNENSITGNSIWSLHKAKNGVMWIGLFKQGLNFYDANYHKFSNLKANPSNPNALNNPNINCFLEDEKGNIWIGTDGGGLNYWNRAQNSFEHLSLNNGKLHTNVVLSIFEDDKKQLWVGSWANGLAIFAPDRKSYRVLNTKNSFLKSDNVTSILQDKKGRIWIITQFGGIQRYHPDSGRHKNLNPHDSITKNYINSAVKIEEDNQGNMWVATRNAGVLKLTERLNSTWYKTQYHSFSENHKLSDDYVNTIVNDNDGVIWVGTQSGLNHYDSVADTFIPITKSDGLKNDVIKGILKDDNNFLWISTANGIIKYNPSDKSFQNFDSRDGLQGNEFNEDSFYKTKNGEFLFGGSLGFNVFNPNTIKKSIAQPRVYIRTLKVFNSPIYPNDNTKILNKHISQIDSLTLSYKDAVVDFEYNALTFRHPEKVEYAHFLEGFETDWKYVGPLKNATYTNLNPGEYTLKIKSTNSDGVWNENITSLHITIVPPYWKTMWFKALAICLSVLLIYLAYFIRIRSIKRYQVNLEQEIDERTKELLQQKNKLMEVADQLSSKNEEIQRFAFAVSHDLKSPLSSIKGIASLIPMEFVIEDFPDMENYLDMINVSCDTMNDLIADITKIAKLGNIENKKEELDTNEIMNLAKILVSGKLSMQNVELNIASNLPAIYGDRNRMIQVFGNLIDNAIKYMGDQKEPKVSVEAKEENNTIQILVKDNGSGMDEKSLQKLFSPFERFHANTKGTGLGLYMIKQIVESHGGKITAISEGIGKGATFMVILNKQS